MKVTGKLRRLGQTDLEVGPLAYGLWRFVGRDIAAARARIEAALDAGMNLIDIAAVYGLDWGGNAFGESETLLGKVLADAPALRRRMVLATKFGIVPGIPYDSSNDAVVKSCEDSLTRLNTDVIDLFQVHRPDALTHPADLAETLARLRTQGKIREVGVSNFNARQTMLLQQFLAFPLATIQPEFSALAIEPVSDGVLDYAISRQMTPLAWSPLAGGRLAADSASRHTAEGERLNRVTAKLDEIAKRDGVSRVAVALAFVMRHPARPIPIVGTQNPERIMSANDALRINLSRADWYAIVVASQGAPLP
ncbi:MAG: aldo/keto reductase [Alphaproteobacteria bacterium]|nr:aldo/keto reductase [Alphaproteobacteria bacterium]